MDIFDKKKELVEDNVEQIGEILLHMNKKVKGMGFFLIISLPSLERKEIYLLSRSNYSSDMKEFIMQLVEEHFSSLEEEENNNNEKRVMN